MAYVISGNNKTGQGGGGYARKRIIFWEKDKHFSGHFFSDIERKRRPPSSLLCQADQGRRKEGYKDFCRAKEAIMLTV